MGNGQKLRRKGKGGFLEVQVMGWLRGGLEWLRCIVSEF